MPARSMHLLTWMSGRCSTEAELTELEFVHDAAVGGEDMGDDNDAETRPTRGEARPLAASHACKSLR